MRFVNWFCRFTLFTGLATLAGLTILYGRNEIFDNIAALYDSIKLTIGIPETFAFRFVIAGIAGVGAIGLLITLLPTGGREREVTFNGTHGEVSIALEPVEATLNRVVQKLPDVKSIDLKIRPIENAGKVRVQGTAILYKDAESDARMITARVCNFITIHTRKIIGVSEIEAKLKVKRWVFRMKTVKPEPLLLEGPDGETMEPEPQRVAARKPSAESVMAAQTAAEAAEVTEVSWDNDGDELIIEGNQR